MSMGPTTATQPGLDHDRRGSGPYPGNGYPIATDPRFGALAYAPHHPDVDSAIHHYSNSRPGPQSVSASGIHAPSWMFNGSAPTSVQLASSQMPYDVNAYQTPRLSAHSSSLAQAVPISVGPSSLSNTSTHPFDPQQIAFQDFTNSTQQLQPVGVPSQNGSHVAAPDSTRRSSDMSQAGSSIPGADLALTAASLHASVDQAPDSAGYGDSNSSGSSARMSGSPEGIPKAFPLSHGEVKAATSLSGSASALGSIESWMASADIGPAFNGESKDSTATLTRPRGPGSISAASASLPFKTSAERRERNKASQRESRKRKQDRLETLESENVALRKALADVKKFSEALSNGAGIKGDDGTEISPIHLTKFSGAIHLDLIETHLEDDSTEPEWSDLVGRRFPVQDASAKEWNGGVGSLLGDQEERDQPEEGTSPVEGASETKVEKSSGSVRRARSATDQRKKAMWELSLNQKRQKTAQSFPSMVAVPELVLYKVCRLYFSLVLPFTTQVKSGIINLRAARTAPAYLGGCDDLPRFRGDASMDPSDEFYLPQNLMPTEAQLRIGFHPVEVAVIPFPSMRDKLLTVLSAFQSLDDFVKQGEDDVRFSSVDGQSQSASDELEDEDIRKRTAFVADMSRWGNGAMVVKPDKNRVYSYGYSEKPKGSHRLNTPAQQWLDGFFYEIVTTLRIWSPAGDVFDPECFEFKESFFRKYPYMVDGQIIRATNRWRRARGEDPIRV